MQRLEGQQGPVASNALTDYPRVETSFRDPEFENGLTSLGQSTLGGKSLIGPAQFLNGKKVEKMTEEADGWRRADQEKRRSGPRVRSYSDLENYRPLEKTIETAGNCEPNVP